MSRDEQFSYIFLLIFAVVFLVWIVPNQIIEGGDATVSPRLLPQLLASLIGLISALQIGRSVLVSSVLQPEFTIQRSSYLILFLITAVLVGMGALLGGLASIGVSTIYVNGIAVGRFWLASLITVPILLLICGVRSWWQIILYTVLLIAIVFFLSNITGIYIQ